MELEPPEPPPIPVWNPGHREGDFKILRVLGHRSDAVVYLATQVSLDRKVALKVSSGKVNPAERIVMLDQDHLVQVYTEADDAHGLRHSVRQFVPGASIGQVASVLRRSPTPPTSGQDILNAIDSLTRDQTLFNAVLGKERLRLSTFSYEQAVAQLGIQLVEALDHAHRHGVLHLNLKPGNILLNSYGRPFIADFTPTDRARRGADVSVDLKALAEILDDLRALGEGDPPLPPGLPSCRLADVFAKQRTAAPGDKGADAKSFARDLKGYLALCEIGATIPAPGFLMRFSTRFPLFSLVMVRQVPHVAGTLVSSAYCMLRHGMPLNPTQLLAMKRILRIYTSISYPFGIAIVILLAIPVIREYRRRRGTEGIAEEPSLAPMRARALRLPWWLAGVNSLTWLPSLGVFTAASYGLTGRFNPDGFFHFATAVVMAWLIATSYSTLYAVFFSVRVLYIGLMQVDGDMRRNADRELATTRRLLRWLPLLMAFIPLLAALLLVQEGAGIGHHQFKFLRTMLIGLLIGGGVGLLLSMEAIRRLRRVTLALTGAVASTQA